MTSLLVFALFCILCHGIQVSLGKTSTDALHHYKLRDTEETAIATLADVNSAKENYHLQSENRNDGSAVNRNVSIEHLPSNHSAERYHVAAFDFEYVDTPLLAAVWILFASAAKIIFHKNKKIAQLFPESCLLILIGVLLGVALYFVHGNGENHQLNARTFFLIILPPIIIDAGYFMPLRPFFDQFGTILLYAVLGTMVNALSIGFTLWGVGRTGVFNGGLGNEVGSENGSLPLLHCLVFASLLAAVDPVSVLAIFDSLHVNDLLHIVVFGESLLNDGISVVLYRMFEGFSAIGMENIILTDIIYGIISFVVVIVGSTLIGLICGFSGGVASRFTWHFRIIEPLVIFVVCYTSFLTAEMFHLSGILSCTFCGMTLRKYAEPNLSHKSQTTIKYVMKIGASVCETIVFMYLGIAAVSDTRRWNSAFILLTLLLCLVYRAAGVLILTFIANRVRLIQLSFVDQFIMAYGGLRGAIAFALVVLLDKHQFPDRSLFITTTIVVIYFTNFVMGSTMGPLVRMLKVKLSQETDKPMTQKITSRVVDYLMAGIEDVVHQHGHHHWREIFSRFSNEHIKRLFGARNRLQRGSDIVSLHRHLVERDAQQLAYKSGSDTGKRLYQILTSFASTSARRRSAQTHCLCETTFTSVGTLCNNALSLNPTTASPNWCTSSSRRITQQRLCDARFPRKRRHSSDGVVSRFNNRCLCICHRAKKSQSRCNANWSNLDNGADGNESICVIGDFKRSGHASRQTFNRNVESRTGKSISVSPAAFTVDSLRCDLTMPSVCHHSDVNVTSSPMAQSSLGGCVNMAFSAETPCRNDNSRSSL